MGVGELVVWVGPVVGVLDGPDLLGDGCGVVVLGFGGVGGGVVATGTVADARGVCVGRGRPAVRVTRGRNVR